MSLKKQNVHFNVEAWSYSKYLHKKSVLFAVSTHRLHEKGKKINDYRDLCLFYTEGEKANQLTLGWLVMLENVN